MKWSIAPPPTEYKSSGTLDTAYTTTLENTYQKDELRESTSSHAVSPLQPTEDFAEIV